MEKTYCILSKGGVPLHNGMKISEVEETVKLELNDVLKLDYLEAGEKLEGKFMLRLENKVYEELVKSDKKGDFLVSVQCE